MSHLQNLGNTNLVDGGKQGEKFFGTHLPIDKATEKFRQMKTRNENMRLLIDTTQATFFVGSDVEAVPVNKWKDNKPDGQATDPKNPSLFAWTINGELCQPNEKPESVRLKMFSATPPVLSPRTEYRVEGVLVAVPYKTGENKKVEVSFTLNGKLLPMTRPQAKAE